MKVDFYNKMLSSVIHNPEKITFNMLMASAMGLFILICNLEEGILEHVDVKFHMCTLLVNL